MTKSQAIELYETSWWEHATYDEIARFQLNEPRLCCPFGVFHEAIEKALGRPVFTHEFGMNVEGLKAELYKGADPPTLQDIIEMIPYEKRIVITAEHQQ